MRGDSDSDSETTAPQRALPFVPLWLLGLLTFSGTLAMHIFVPALPSAAADLQVGAAAMQMTISLYIVGLAVGQLIYGPVSDRFGRRPTLIAGLLLYTVAGLAALLAPDVHTLIAARLVQALGGCAGLVLARAIVRDTSETKDAARRLALMNLMVAIGPGAAPIIGGLLAASVGWRSIFILLTALGLTNLVLAWRMLPETAASAVGQSAAALAKDYGRLLRTPAFLGYAIGGGCATTSLYAFVAAAPFIFVQQLHRPTYEVGPCLALLIVGAWLGNALASRLIGRVPMKRLLVCANGVSLLAAFALLALVLSGQMSVGLIMGTMFVLTLGLGTGSPAALTEAISVNPKVIGSASGLYGFAQMAIGALCTTLVGFGDDPALAAALVLAGAGIGAQGAFWIAGRGPPDTFNSAP